MTTVGVQDIGYCADFSRQGDWAFDFALGLARTLNYGLNVFYVPDLAWDSPNPPPKLSPKEIVELERRVRSYYDERLGDFVEVGFRICEGFADVELRRCMLHRDYQVLVLAYPRFGVPFAGRSIEAFAYAFNAPVVLVGPDRPDQYFLNPPAVLLHPQLGLAEGEWSVLAPSCEAPTAR
jgi:hypothetical protein